MLLALIAACNPVAVDLSGPEPAAARPAPHPIAYAAPLGEPDWLVDCKGGGDFETITEAIDVGVDGDWIAVAPCTYEESLDLGGKSLWIASTGSSDDTILDARGNRALNASFGEGDGSALVGFTISNARDASGSAVYVDQAALRLSDVVFSESGGGYAVIYATSADLELEDVRIDDSNNFGYYGGVFVSRGAVSADNLEVTCDGGSYALYVGHGSYFIDHSSLDCGRGYAFYDEHAVGRFHRSTLASPVYVLSEDDHYTDFVIFENVHFLAEATFNYGSVLIRNSLVDASRLVFTDVYGTYIQASVLQNSSCAVSYTWTPQYEEDEDTADTAEPAEIVPEVDISYNDFFEVTHENCDNVTTYSGADGNIAADPQFTDEAGGDYSTSSRSPLVDAGLPDEAYLDPDGTVNDIGLYGGPRSIGGGW